MTFAFVAALAVSLSVAGGQSSVATVGGVRGGASRSPAAVAPDDAGLQADAGQLEAAPPPADSQPAAELAPDGGQPQPVAPKGPVVVPPTAACPKTPDYPSSERGSGVRGAVLLKLTILETGSLGAIEVSRPLGKEFDAVALASAQQCSFSAATVDGKPVASVIELSVDFVPPVDPWTLDGEVVGELGEPLAGAQVTYGGKTTLTDTAGHFTLVFDAVPPGDAWVLVTHLGHAERGYPETFQSGVTTRVRYELKKLKVYETRVEGSRTLPPVPEPDRTPQVSRFKITKSDIDRTPGAMEDVARVAQQAPGVAADPDLLGTLFVRGGGPDETIFYLDGVPLSNPYHLGGYASLFNPMMLDQAEFYTGGVPGRYEPTLSGALEVHYATGETKKPKVRADVSMQTAMLRADVPLGIEGLSAVVSVRRSYFEAYFAVLRALKIVGSSFVAPEITELLARVNFRRGRHQTTATYLYASDGLNFIIKPGEELLFNFAGGLNISNRTHLAILQHRIDFAGDSRLTFTGAYTRDDNAISVSSERRFSNDAYRNDFLFRADGVWAHSDRHNTKLGLQYSHRTLNLLGEVTDTRGVAPWRSDPFVETYLPYLSISPAVTRDLIAVYLEHTYRPVDPFTIEGSGRAQIDARTAQWSGSTRLAAAWTLPFSTVLKVSGGFAAQPPTLPLYLDPTYGNPKLQPEQSYQAVIGLEQPLPIEALLRLEVWGKYLDKLVVNPDTQAGVDAVLASGQPAFQNRGTGFARGADLMFIGRTRHLYYGVSMGLMFSDRTNPMASGVQTYATPWDQRFTSNLSLSWSPTQNWVITGRFTFRTGRPYTPVQGFFADDANQRYVPQFADTNSGRYPGFYELNLRAEQRFRLGPLQMAWYAEVLNVTYSNNVFAYTYDKGNYAAGQEPQRGELNHLPIRPFLGLRGEY